jgi:NAD-dependent dihydropyrimidine dehydrogenase PreA subunit
MAYVVAEPCVDILDKSCIEECPVDCIYEGARTMYIHPDECVDCGACEAVCPVQAISYEDDLPPEHSVFTESARQFFVHLGSPGGAGKHGKIHADSEFVSGLPPRDHGDPGA